MTNLTAGTSVVGILPYLFVWEKQKHESESESERITENCQERVAVAVNTMERMDDT